jgi:hypothetical protein
MSPDFMLMHSSLNAIARNLSSGSCIIIRARSSNAEKIGAYGIPKYAFGITSEIFMGKIGPG